MQLYKWYGDIKVLKRAYPMMKRYVEYLQTKAQNHILDYGLGDWYDLGPNHPGIAQLTPKAVTATSIFYYDLQIVAKTAEIFGFQADINQYKDLSVKIKDAFLSKYYNAETGVCATGSQTAYAMPLYVGIIPPRDEGLVLNNLVDSIISNDYTLTSGDIGYHFLVRVLSENGRSDILYKMNCRTDRPGYGYQLKQGATSLTESWAALSDVSNNHMMLGHLMEWFYAGLGGIHQSDISLAYSDIIIAPKPVGNINWVKCSYNSIKGVISSDWKLEADTIILNIEIPEEASAKIVLPDQYMKSSLAVIDLTKQIAVETETDKGIFTVTSGKYKVTAH
jgi:hypothetical protein